MGCSESKKQVTDKKESFASLRINEMGKCKFIGVILLIIIVAILAYIIYCKTYGSKTLVDLDLARMGFPTDVVVLPDITFHQ